MGELYQPEGTIDVSSISCYCFLTSYSELLAWEQHSHHRLLKSKTEQSRALAGETVRMNNWDE